MTALGAALYHDCSLAEDTRPIEDLWDALLADDASLQQFCVPVAPRKEAPSTFRREQLLQRVKRDELASFLVGTPATIGDADAVTVGVVLQPSTAAAQEGRAGYRYRLDVALGAAAVNRRGAASIVDALVACANAVKPRAGVVFPADTASFAHALATGTRGGLTEEQDRRVKDVFYAVYELGDKIRGPEWGTFLGPHHVAKLGGLDRIEKESGCAVVRRLAHGGAYLQITGTHDDPGVDAGRTALATFLSPVM